MFKVATHLGLFKNRNLSIQAHAQRLKWNSYSLFELSFSQYCRYYIKIQVRIHKVSGPIVDLNPDPDESRFHFIFAMS